MSAAHTPGPWIVDGGIHLVGDAYSKIGQHALYCAAIRQSDFVGSVCSIQSADHCDGAITRDAAEANARLIAAAPDLLKALEDIAGYYPNSWASDTARAAIAKATGETK